MKRPLRVKDPSRRRLSSRNLQASDDMKCPPRVEGKQSTPKLLRSRMTKHLHTFRKSRRRKDACSRYRPAESVPNHSGMQHIKFSFPRSRTANKKTFTCSGNGQTSFTLCTFLFRAMCTVYFFISCLLFKLKK